MFLGPLEQSKPWDTNGIDGVHRFLKKFWGLFFKGDDLQISDDQPTADELKALHKLIKKVSFVPKYGYTGTVTIKYNAYKSGSSTAYPGVIKITYGTSASSSNKEINL